MFDGEWDFVIIPDTRFPNEIDLLKQEGFIVDHLRVVRPGFENDLTPEQRMHPSETALDNVEPDAYINNDGTFKGLYDTISKWLEENIDDFSR